MDDWIKRRDSEGMKLNLWMIVNRLREMDIDVHIKDCTTRNMRSARLAYATNCAYVYQDGGDVICADEEDYIRIRNIEKNVAFEIIQGIFDYYNNWSEELETAISNGNKSELIQVLWKVFQNPIIFFNASQGVIAMTRQYGYGEVDEEWDYLLRYGSSSLKAVQKIQGTENSIIGQSGIPKKVVMKKNSVITPYLSAVITQDNIRRGQIVIIEKGWEINNGDMELLKYAVGRIEKGLKEKAYNNSAIMDINAIIDLILGKSVNRDDLERQMLHLGWKRDDQYRVLVVFAEKDNAEPKKQMNLIYSAMRSFFHSIGCFTYEDHLILVMNDNIQETTWTRPNVRRIMQENHGVVSGGYSIGGIENIRFSYQQALWAFGRGLFGVGGRNRYDYFSCALDYLVQCMWVENTDVHELLYSCHPDVIKLWKIDAETEGNYIRTLVVFLQNERSLVGTANALHIHRSTLIYRIKKLEELMGSDLADSYNREYILTTVRLLNNFKDEIPDIKTVDF